MRGAIAICLIAATVFGQKQNQTPDIYARLSQGVDMGAVMIRPLPGDLRQLRFSLATSWIAGEGHLGYLRYRMTVSAPDLDLSKTIETMEKAHSCKFRLVLYDDGKFKLREFQLTFMSSMSSGGYFTQMETNEMGQLNLAEYRSFLKSQAWVVVWDDASPCGVPQPKEQSRLAPRATVPPDSIRRNPSDQPAPPTSAIIPPKSQRRSSCSPAIESAISGEIEGWSGETIFKLDNGQIWQQAE